MTAEDDLASARRRLSAVPWVVILFCWPATLLGWYFITLVADPSWWRDRFLLHYLTAMMAVDSIGCLGALQFWTRHARAMRGDPSRASLEQARRVWVELLALPERTAALLVGLILLTLAPGTVILLTRATVELVGIGYAGAAMAAACELTVLVPVVQHLVIPTLRRLKAAHPSLGLRDDGARPGPIRTYFAFGLVAISAVSIALVATLIESRTATAPRYHFPEGPAVALAIVCIGSMSAGIALHLYSAVLVPLTRLASAMRRFSTEEVGVRVGLLHVGEVGLLCEHFDEMAAALEQSRARLAEREALLRHAQRFEVMGTVTATFAHEVANPLTCVALSLEVVDAEVGALTAPEPPPPTEATHSLTTCREALADALSATQQMQLLLRDMRTFSRREGDVHLACNAAAMLDGALRLASGELRKHQAEVVREYDDCPPVLGTPHKLSQVLLNLVLNAVQALVAGRKARVGVAVRPLGDRVEIAITDNGHGIAPEHRQRVFDAFFTTKPEGVGTGLGLFVSKKIVTEHGGELAFDTEVGVGTTFRIVLPVAPPSTPSAAPVS
ncbi:MAG: HAMP domain-containing histidine kinase [Polyangiaceae bacterium]|nr:HAMP domain-containing histidine kinase [Polyangiaceae bacterium]